MPTKKKINQNLAVRKEYYDLKTPTPILSSSLKKMFRL